MKADRTLAVGLTLALLVGTLPPFVIGGPSGAYGYLIGLAAAAFSFAGLAGIVWLIGRGDATQKPPLAASLLILIALFIKLPVYTVAAIFAQGLNPPGPDCFAASVVLVYSAATALLVLSGKAA